MDRRFLQVVALALAACGQKRPLPRAAAVDAAPVMVAAAPAPADAAPEEVAPPIKPSDVFSGPAAERIIAEQVTPREPLPEGASELGIRPYGVGPLELGMSRREVAARLKTIGRYLFRRVWTPPGEVGLEVAEVQGADGEPLLRLQISGGRLSQIAILGRDARARTEADVQIGSTFDDAVLAHGDARRSGRGWVLSDLPGVVFVPVDGPLSPAPPPTARIGMIVVVGPESD